MQSKAQLLEWGDRDLLWLNFNRISPCAATTCIRDPGAIKRDYLLSFVFTISGNRRDQSGVGVEGSLGPRRWENSVLGRDGVRACGSRWAEISRNRCTPALAGIVTTLSTICKRWLPPLPVMPLDGVIEPQHTRQSKIAWATCRKAGSPPSVETT